ncbi:hypothetical protein IscW_ISCW011560 [Ixodes scapularis]|uniref:Uncharacterized protein n=1 Tax=Ixodes scapularis TaxID=6945 RepID=B7Q5Z1_IXOSC|nr:hypothetical protein IscW_ISCW011560 [Ixodes scapularis]|eukprot:XP_002411843.1 hypothetical protein IscW_ISCW011560 [Ixodes scapularis]
MNPRLNHLRLWFYLAVQVFGSICLGLMLYYTSYKGTNSFGMFGHEMYFILTAFGCLLCTFLLLVSSCWSFTSSSLLSRTSFVSTLTDKTLRPNP